MRREWMKGNLAWVVFGCCFFFIGCSDVSKQDRALLKQNILVLGDSLAAAYRLDPAQGFCALLQEKLRAEGFEGVTIVVDAESGSLAKRGPDRFKARLSQGVYHGLILQLGANEGLRGMDLGEMKRNLLQVIEDAKKEGMWVLLCGMKIPPHHGFEYSARFGKIYEELAKEHGVTRIPFLLKGVAGKPSLNLDGLHPNAEGHRKVMETVWKFLKPILRRELKKTLQTSSRS